MFSNTKPPAVPASRDLAAKNRPVFVYVVYMAYALTGV
jgi:hypothetical protein